DVLLEIERLFLGGDMLRGDDSALDHEDVETSLDGRRRPLTDSLRGEAGGGHDAGGLHLLDPLTDQLGLDRLQVDLLHPARRLLVWELRDLLEVDGGVLVPGPQPLEVEDSETAET